MDERRVSAARAGEGDFCLKHVDFYRDAALGPLVRRIVPGGKLMVAGASGRIAVEMAGPLAAGAITVGPRAVGEFWTGGRTAPTRPLVRQSGETAFVALSIREAGGIALKLGSPRLKLPFGRLKVFPLEGTLFTSACGTVAVAGVFWVGTTAAGGTILIGLPGAVEFATCPTSGIARSRVKAYLKEVRAARWCRMFI